MPDDWADPSFTGTSRRRTRSASATSTRRYSTGRSATADYGDPGRHRRTRNRIVGHIFPSEKTGITLYIQVRDLSASLEQAAQLGRHRAEPAVPNTGAATIAGITTRRQPPGTRAAVGVRLRRTDSRVRLSPHTLSTDAEQTGLVAG